jgi:flagellar motor switch/type III secretory pathway protein FliN
MSSTQHWTPLRWCSATDLADLSRSLDSAVCRWKDGWLGDAHGPLARSRCRVAHEASERNAVDWRLLGRNSDATAWICIPDRAREEMSRAFFAGEHGQIVAEVARTACVEYEEALRIHLDLFAQPSRETASAETFHRWGGAVFAELPLAGEQRCLMLMNAACVTRRLGAHARPKAVRSRSSELVSCESALASTKVSLHVELAHCELEIGNLAALQVGDVIPWPHDLEHPLDVCMSDGTQICSGHLGRVDASKAVELLA